MAKKTEKKTGSSWKDFMGAAISGGFRQGSDKIPLDQAKDMLNGFLQWAGKSKDEVLQLMAAEAATAFANTLKEPLVQILKSKNVSIEIKLQEKTDATSEKQPEQKAARKSKVAKKRTAKRTKKKSS